MTQLNFYGTNGVQQDISGTEWVNAMESLKDDDLVRSNIYYNRRTKDPIVGTWIANRTITAIGTINIRELDFSANKEYKSGTKNCKAARKRNANNKLQTILEAAGFFSCKDIVLSERYHRYYAHVNDTCDYIPGIGVGKFRLVRESVEQLLNERVGLLFDELYPILMVFYTDPSWKATLELTKSIKLSDLPRLSTKTYSSDALLEYAKDNSGVEPLDTVYDVIANIDKVPNNIRHNMKFKRIVLTIDRWCVEHDVSMRKLSVMAGGRPKDTKFSVCII